MMRLVTERKDLLKVLADEDKVDTAEPELSDAEEDVRDQPGWPRDPPERGVGGGEEAGVGHVAVGQVVGPSPGAQLLGVTNQQMHAVNTNDAHQHQTCHRDYH